MVKIRKIKDEYLLRLDKAEFEAFNFLLDNMDIAMTKPNESGEQEYELPRSPEWNWVANNQINN